jgi:hypothetical protein
MFKEEGGGGGQDLNAKLASRPQVSQPRHAASAAREPCRQMGAASDDAIAEAARCVTYAAAIARTGLHAIPSFMILLLFVKQSRVVFMACRISESGVFLVRAGRVCL